MSYQHSKSIAIGYKGIWLYPFLPCYHKSLLCSGLTGGLFVSCLVLWVQFTRRFLFILRQQPKLPNLKRTDQRVQFAQIRRKAVSRLLVQQGCRFGNVVLVLTAHAEQRTTPYSPFITYLRKLAVCRRVIFRGTKRQFEPLRAPHLPWYGSPALAGGARVSRTVPGRTRSLKVFLTIFACFAVKKRP